MCGEGGPAPASSSGDTGMEEHNWRVSKAESRAVCSDVVMYKYKVIEKCRLVCVMGPFVSVKITQLAGGHPGCQLPNWNVDVGRSYL